MNFIGISCNEVEIISCCVKRGLLSREFCKETTMASFLGNNMRITLSNEPFGMFITFICISSSVKKKVCVQDSTGEMARYDIFSPN